MKKIILIFKLLLSFFSCTSKEKSKNLKRLEFRDDDVVFIINADDVGMDENSDKAVFDLYEKGKIQTYSIMVNTPNYREALKYSLKNNVPVGVHLTLTNEWQEKNSWTPLLSKEEVPSLYNEEGYMWASVDEIKENVKIEEARKELKSHIDKALTDGLDVTHIDFHMLFWRGSEEIVEMAYDLVKEYKLPMVHQIFWESTKKQLKISKEFYNKGIIVVDKNWMYYNPDRRKKNPNKSFIDYSRMFKRAQSGIHHLAIHPSVLNNQVMVRFKDGEFRYDEYMVFQDEKLNKIIKKKNIKFTDYRRMRDLNRVIKEN